MQARPINDGKPWTRDQLILAFELYCRIPFRYTKANNRQVKDLAKILERTPASVARKLGNFGAFDPSLAAQSISGLTHGSKLDKRIWDEFHKDWSSLVTQASELRSTLQPSQPMMTFEPPSGPSERKSTTSVRLHQTFFRDAVISSYDGRCCITGLPIIECLVAGHIIPWSVDETRRADPTNGICMSATFDRLFDSGLMTINDDFTIMLSRQLIDISDRAVFDLIIVRNNQPIIRPTRFLPDLSCLQWHREHVFRHN